MSKRCDLQKEYYKKNGNYKGSGQYRDSYVMWLEDQILTLRNNQHDFSKNCICEDSIGETWCCNQCGRPIPSRYDKPLINQ